MMAVILKVGILKRIALKLWKLMFYTTLIACLCQCTFKVIRVEI